MDVDVKVLQAMFEWRRTEEGDELIVTIVFSEEQSSLLKPMFDGVVHVDMNFYPQMLDGVPYIVVQLIMGSGTVHLWFDRSYWEALGEEPDEIVLQFGDDRLRYTFFGKRLGSMIDAWLAMAEHETEQRVQDGALDPVFLRALLETFS
ncbi:MAG: hypothetical protein RBR24_02160 [Candidatus Carbobacillus sp.]|nr:hypothetical protein [Candidatus Carbobacillus sp.]